MESVWLLPALRHVDLRFHHDILRWRDRYNRITSRPLVLSPDELCSDLNHLESIFKKRNESSKNKSARSRCLALFLDVRRD